MKGKHRTLHDTFEPTHQAVDVHDRDSLVQAFTDQLTHVWSFDDEAKYALAVWPIAGWAVQLGGPDAVYVSTYEVESEFRELEFFHYEPPLLVMNLMEIRGPYFQKKSPKNRRPGRF